MRDWDDLRVFLAVHRTRSHAAAARSLRVAATTVGRRLASLEADVGARLFTRTPEGLVGTSVSRALLVHAERMEAEVLESERLISGADARPTGRVRLTCGDGFAIAILAPGLPAFLQAHPGLEVEIRAEPRVLDLTRGEADVALRNVRPREGSLIARRLGVERYGLFAAPTYLARRGTPRSARDLTSHDLVLYDREYDRLRTQTWFRQTAAGARAAVRTSNTNDAARRVRGRGRDRPALGGLHPRRPAVRAGAAAPPAARRPALGGDPRRPPPGGPRGRHAPVARPAGARGRDGDLRCAWPSANRAPRSDPI